MGNKLNLKPLKLIALATLLGGCVCADLVMDESAPEKIMAMPDKAKKAKQATTTDVTSTLELRGGKLYELRRGSRPVAVPAEVLFKFDSYSVPASAKAALRKHARFLNENPRRNMRIVGHCDERGTREYNLALGELRARAVSRYIENQGVSNGRIQTASAGEEKPVDAASNERAWAKNRRAPLDYSNKRQ